MKNLAIIISAGFLAVACGRYKPPVSSVLSPEQSISKQPESNPTLGWQVFENREQKYSISYPESFILVPADKINEKRAQSYIPVCEEYAHGCLWYSLPDGPKTNFEAAAISVDSFSTKTAEVCYSEAGNSWQAAFPVKINGLDFKHFTTSDAGAGHVMQSQMYLYFNGQGACYKLVQNITSTNIGVYEPGTVREFDAAKIAGEMNQVLNTFKISGAAQ